MSGSIKYEFYFGDEITSKQKLEIYKSGNVKLVIEQVCNLSIEKSILYQLFKQKSGFAGFEMLTTEQLKDLYRKHVIAARKGRTNDKTERENIKSCVGTMLESGCVLYLLLQQEMIRSLAGKHELTSVFSLEIENEYNDYPVFKLILLYPDVSDVHAISHHLDHATRCQEVKITDTEIYHLISPITLCCQMNAMFV